MERETKKARFEETASFDEENEEFWNIVLLDDKEVTISSLKTELKQRLRDIATTNRAVQLCDLLIKAQKKHNDFKDCLDDDYRILCDIQNLQMKKPFDTMLNFIFKTLQLPHEDELHTKQQELESQLMSDLEEGLRKPSEYLNFLIENLEGLVSLFDPSYIFAYSIDLEKDYEKNLETLKKFISHRGEYEAGCLLDVIFDIGKKKADFSSEEKEEVLNLLFKAMPNIEIFINIYCCQQRYCLDLFRYKKRSALQFIIDIFLSYPDKSAISVNLIGILDESRKYLDDFFARVYTSVSDDSDEEECSGIFIETACNASKTKDESGSAFFEKIESDDTDDEGMFSGCDSDRVTLKYFFRAGEEIPRGHTWWNTYKKAHIK